MLMQKRRCEEKLSSGFSTTYTRLSKYLKEKGGLPTTMSLLPEDGDPAKQPMDLFPQHAGFGPSMSDGVESSKAQLTIFYQGQVLVLDDFPADKAADLMKMAAGGGSGLMSINKTSAVVADPARPTTDLPIARRASLYRFLEKRKDRVNSIAPYQVPGTCGSESAVIDGMPQPWLGFGRMEPALSSEGSS